MTILLSLTTEQEREQRVIFRRYIEDNMSLMGKYFSQSDFNISGGCFSSSTLEYYFVGWVAQLMAKKSGGDVTKCLGYVKTKLDEKGEPVCTSFSAVPADDHQPVGLLRY